ncbi:metal-dependent hydrolase [Halomicroarcula sp. GCM10025324]|uniref:metal-dependent hydrolase n=1 Tax=Haloarcula TaxID=2237 RepID=UPI0023E7B4B9|nr:metal-dependent hydrolase [Halomicroarcula sp. ZS-22-S1]
MYRNGHYGLNLLLYAPVGAALLLLREPLLSMVGWGLAVGLATTPDLDHRLPLVSHRGITHTVWAALAASVVCGGLLYVTAGSIGAYTPVEGAVVGALGATVGILGHVAGDAMTPMGVTPFTPLSKSHYSLQLWTADSTIANYGLLLSGVFVTSLVVLMALRTVYAVPV